ncbi:MAG: two component transcriptional regulator, winged helix family [Solirubrobacterales bacterium]|jgi:DNA-binding response OmpR family regulator|nr:two component transcriptional regulator, winged helix family [Solirubrobacterales bacterium]
MTDSDSAATVLVVEDDAPTRAFLTDNLAADGYAVLAAPDVRGGLDLLASSYPDVLLADVHLPDGSGLELIRHVRAADGLGASVDPRTPVLVLSGRSAEVDRLRAFEQGADDVLPKPYSYPELRARLAALLWRADDRPARTRLRSGPVELDPATRIVRVHGRPVDLAAKEFALLRALAADPTRVFTKDELLRSVWGFRSPGSTRTLDSHACRLRQKLAAAGACAVVNVWGVGYRLVDGPA